MTNTLRSFIAAYNLRKEFLGRTSGQTYTNLTLQKGSFSQGTAQGTGDIAYLRVTQYENNNTTGTINDIDNAEIQLEVGDTETNYVEHEEQTIHFPFAEGQVLHKDDYLADNGIHHKRKTIVLDGTETWYDSDKKGNYQWFSYGGLSGVKVSEFICSHLKNYEIAGEYVGISSRRTANRIYLSISEDINTVDELKSYLAEQYANDTPVVIEYELAEEIVEAYTEEQKEAYNYLQHLLMYENYNYITCINEIKPNLQLTYYYNNELNKTYAKRLDELEKEVNIQINEVNEQLTNVYEEFMKKEENETILNLTIPPTGGSDSYANYPNGFNSENCYVAGVMMYRKHPDNQTYTTWYNLSGNYYVRLEVNKVVLNVGVDFSEQYLGNQAKIILKKYTD